MWDGWYKWLIRSYRSRWWKMMFVCYNSYWHLEIPFRNWNPETKQTTVVDYLLIYWRRKMATMRFVSNHSLRAKSQETVATNNHCYQSEDINLLANEKFITFQWIQCVIKLMTRNFRSGGLTLRWKRLTVPYQRSQICTWMMNRRKIKTSSTFLVKIPSFVYQFRREVAIECQQMKNWYYFLRFILHNSLLS